jgi:hypothetical protein
MRYCMKRQRARYNLPTTGLVNEQLGTNSQNLPATWYAARLPVVI